MGPVQARSSRPGSSEGTIDDNGFVDDIPPASKDKADEMIVLIVDAPGGD
jgi:ClpP class serine protease